LAIRLPTRLKINDLDHTLAGEDVMVSPDTKLEVEGKEQLYKLIEANAGVGDA